MKKNILLLVYTLISFSVSAADGWVVSEINSKRFIENKSQFDGRDKLINSEILFGVDEGGAQIYFTKHGLTYRFDKAEIKKQRLPNA